VIARKEAAKATILQEALASISQRTGELPHEVRELSYHWKSQNVKLHQLLETCQIVSAQLNGELNNSDLDILGDDIDYFIVREMTHIAAKRALNII
jgi:hypothetical protein